MENTDLDNINLSYERVLELLKSVQAFFGLFLETFYLMYLPRSSWHWRSETRVWCGR